MKKSAVFNGRDRIDHDLGNVVILDEAALGAQLAVEQAGDKLRLKLVSGEIAGVAKRGNFLHTAVFDADNGALSVVIRFFTRLDLDGVLHDFVDAKL